MTYERELIEAATIVEQLHDRLQEIFGPMPVSYEVERDEHGVIDVTVIHEVREYVDGSIRYGEVLPKERGYAVEERWHIWMKYHGRRNNRFAVELDTDRPDRSMFDDVRLGEYEVWW
jgi:hypothetical protein